MCTPQPYSEKKASAFDSLFSLLERNFPCVGRQALKDALSDEAFVKALEPLWHAAHEEQKQKQFWVYLCVPVTARDYTEAEKLVTWALPDTQKGYGWLKQGPNGVKITSVTNMRPSAFKGDK